MQGQEKQEEYMEDEKELGKKGFKLEEETSESEMEGDDEPEEEYTAWSGKKVKVEYFGTKLKALRGSMHIEYSEKTQIVRIFTSSTFTGLCIGFQHPGSVNTTILSVLMS